MGIWFNLLLVLHGFLCLLMILLVLLQNDKAGGLAGAFGGMGGGAAFSGGSTVTILTKITQYVGAASFVVLLLIGYLGMKGHSSARGESELKAANKGLSTALPAPRPSTSAVPSIPGLGGDKPVTKPAESGN